MRIVSLLGACFVLCTCGFSSAAEREQAKAAVSPRIGIGFTPEDLLSRSHNIGHNLPLEERCAHLFRLAEASGRMNSVRAKAMTRSWSNELLRIASELPPSWNRTAFQKNALETLSVVDPVSAFELLQKVDAPEGDSVEKIPEDLRSFAAQRIFSRFWDVKGVSAIEAIRSRARDIGMTGEYPYVAMGQVSERLAAQNKMENVRAIFREALDFYDKGPRVRSANKEFIAYLESDWQYLPVSLQDEGLKVVVGHLTRTAEPDHSIIQVRRVTADNGTISFRNEGIGLLYSILPRIRQHDPEWANRLEDEYPDLKQAAANGKVQYTSDVTVINSTSASQEQVAAALNNRLQSGTLDHLRQLATTDPYRAANLLPSLSSPGLQSEALASLASAFATKNPEHAAELLAGAQTLADKLPSEPAKLGALISICDAAAALHDYQRFDEIMESAFDLGEELLAEELDVQPGDLVYASEPLEDLSSLTRSAAQISFHSLIIRIDHLENETLHAYLLIAAAEGLQKKTTLPSSAEQSPR